MANSAFLPKQSPFVLDHGRAMTEFEQVLLSNSGEDAFEIAVKLLAAKLIDERRAAEGLEVQFRIQETPEATFKAISDLYLSALCEWPVLAMEAGPFNLDAHHLVRAISPLLGWRLTGSDFSCLDATLEHLVSKQAKGAMGQYFTPRDTIRMCVAILNPHPQEKLLDPACGSAGFLFEAAHHTYTRYGAPPEALGIDFGTRSIKVATLLAAASPDTRVYVTKANSIDGRAYAHHHPMEWSTFLIDECGGKTRQAQSWGAWNKLGCDVLFTNPPYAGDIDDAEVIAAYEALQDPSARKAMGREHLFLERAVHMLKPGGRLAIVLPQGLLANPTSSYLRNWVLAKCRVLGVVGLHPYAFLPHTSVKTSVLFLSRLHPGETVSGDAKVFFGVSQACGKDSSGRPEGAADYDEITRSFKSFLAGEGFGWASEVPGGMCMGNRHSAIAYSEMLVEGRMDAEYYDRETLALVQQIQTASDSKINRLVAPRIERFKRKGYTEIGYVDISSVDGRTGLTHPEVIDAQEAPSRASYLVKEGDVLVSTVRPNRNIVALVTGRNAPPLVASNGFCVLRPQNVKPEVLYTFCKTGAFSRMLSRHATASMYPTVGDKDVLELPFPTPPKDVEDKVTDLVRSGLDMLEKAYAQLDEAIAIMNGFVEMAGTDAKEGHGE